MSKFAVKLHRPWQWTIAVSVLSMILAMITWLLLDNSHWRYIEDKLSGNQDYKLLWEVNQTLEQENVLLREKVMMLEQTTNIDKQTAGIVQGEIKNLQDEIHHLKDELEFYREIMDTASRAKGLDIQGIYIKPLRQAGSYRLKLILTHVGKAGTVVEGMVDVVFEGTSGENNMTVGLTEIGLEKGQTFAYSFRNFQRFESDFLLPENFNPQRVSVNLLHKNKRDSRLKKVFDWSESTTER